MTDQAEKSVARAGLAPTRAVLENGAVVIGKKTSATPAVSINIALGAGSICDPVDAPGATWLLSRVLDRGTAGRSSDDIAEALDSRGITLTIAVTRHLLSLACTCRAVDFEAVFELMGDVIVAPSFPDGEIATRKGQVITAIRQDLDNPAVRAGEGLMALLYPGGHPYGRPTKGTLAVVEGLTRPRLLQLHAARFVPSQLTAVVVGDVDVSRATDAAERAFGGWRAPAPAPIPLESPPRPVERRRLVIPMMNKAQADICYGFVAITRSDPSYYAFWLMNNVFGQYAMAGRLGDSIRERQGMAYYVSSALDANIVEGPLVIRAGVNPANVDRAVASIDEEVASIAKDGVTPKELDESRRYLTGSLPRALETNEAIAHFLQQAEFFGLGLDYDVRLPELLRSVTLDGVNATARTLDPGRATVVIAGPYES